MRLRVDCPCEFIPSPLTVRGLVSSAQRLLLLFPHAQTLILLRWRAQMTWPHACPSDVLRALEAHCVASLSPETDKSCGLACLLGHLMVLSPPPPHFVSAPSLESPALLTALGHVPAFQFIHWTGELCAELQGLLALRTLSSRTSY